MQADAAGRRYWHEVLTAGGFTPVPRWPARPGGEPGHIGRHDVADPGLGALCRRLSARLGVPVSALLLAVHVKVLSVLTGQPDVVTGYRPKSGPTRAGGALPCRLEAGPGTWRDLVAAAAAAERALLRHRGYPVARLARDLRLPEPLFDVVLDLGRPAAPHLPGGAVASAGLGLSESGLRLALRFRTDVMDAEHAARLAGYYLRALRLLIARPAACHRACSLLSTEEVELLRDGLAGPRRPLPDRRFHELFQERAHRQPDAVAVEHGGRRWTYGELNRRANRVAGALLGRGARPEDVVAVVMERHLDWMASVIGVFKAGCAYLPVEPHFPADRVGAMLARSGCRVALTEPGSDASLRQAGSAGALTVLPVGAVEDEGHGDRDVAVPVDHRQLAYVYFTSGSTGQPKGAMVEQAGMLNHLLAKLEDLSLGPGTVVAQTAPQCFDISLWQLLAATLAGGRTLIVEQSQLLQVERLVDTLTEARVGVLQLVPSHLDVVLSHLEQRGRSLPDLRCVSATGEALGRGLVERWFASQPDVRLVNAYGLTETSDDTNHEIMDRPPAAERIPVGRAVRNVQVSVVDEDLSLTPVGTPGQIVFSGVCVGRGYVNDPRLTALAFRPDPYRAGERLYCSGDFGRWLPGGTLEFLGRRDAQVKVRGFRIEIGEVEHRLEQMEGVSDSAVVVVGDGEQGRELVGFYSGPAALSVPSLRAFLGGSLPEYMIPSRFRWLPALPLTHNGKTDRKRLAHLAAELGPAEPARRAPETPTERWLAGAWAELLGVPAAQVGRDDDFFEHGGTSLSAVRLVIKLDRRVTLEDLAAHGRLADLARLVDDRAATAGLE